MAEWPRCPSCGSGRWRREVGATVHLCLGCGASWDDADARQLALEVEPDG